MVNMVETEGCLKKGPSVLIVLIYRIISKTKQLKLSNSFFFTLEPVLPLTLLTHFSCFSITKLVKTKL